MQGAAPVFVMRRSLGGLVLALLGMMVACYVRAAFVAPNVAGAAASKVEEAGLQVHKSGYLAKFDVLLAVMAIFKRMSPVIECMPSEGAQNLQIMNHQWFNHHSFITDHL
eukprot:Skav206842  [mRNA]  locus=scaffold637:263581:265234:- [translate_table: standard]